jgi:hypothetical protein
MDFLPLLPLLPDSGIEPSVTSWTAMLNNSPEEPGSNHWGLNE